MLRGWLSYLVVCLCALLVALEPSPVRAAGNVAKADCHSFGTYDETYEKLASQPSRWVCDSRKWSDKNPVAWLHFDLGGIPTPSMLVTRLTLFDRLDIGIIDRDGNEDWQQFSIRDIHPLTSGLRFTLPLPYIPYDARAVVVRIERPGNAVVLSEARLMPAGENTGWEMSTMLLIAGLVGLLCAPLMFNIAFYNVLRERFVLWHLAMVVGMIGYTLTSSGLIMHLIQLDAWTLATLNSVLFVIPAAMAGFFSADFLETRALTPRMRAALRVAAMWTLAVAGTLSFAPSTFYPYANDGYMLCFVPVLVVYVAAMVQAVRNGSRSVWFQLVGWTPMVMVGVERILRGLGLYGAPLEADQLIYVVMTIEVMATTFGIADRLLIIRRQRDQARLRARILESLADRDPLTGLFNRRAVELRFADAYAAGFSSLALIDIDYFKAINDTWGHAKGDEVLRAIAVALAPDDDIIAVRIGGEEFLLLIRGANPIVRAEQRRQALPGRVAAAVPGLDRIVTASMGVIECLDGHPDAPDFTTLYARCDRLLYRAKNNGRNRMEHEEMQPDIGMDNRHPSIQSQIA